MRTIRECKVCVVGGAGFLGSHLVNDLVDDRGCKVLVIDNLAAGRLEFVHKDADFEDRDITCDEGVLRGILKGYEAEYVFNYAAIPYVPLSYSRPLHVFNVNAMGAIKVIHASQEAGVKAILQVSSAELYGGLMVGQDGGSLTEAGYTGKIDELHPVSPHSSYGASKAAIDYFVQAGWKERRTPCIALRQFNAYGPNETHPYVIPEIISQIHHGGTTIKLGNNSSRDFQYAGDAVRSAVELLEKGQFGDVYNLGSQDSISIYNLAQKIATAMGFGRVTIQEDESRKRAWEIWNLTSDNSKVYSVIEYRHQTPLEEGLKLTIDAYRRNGCRWSFECQT